MLADVSQGLCHGGDIDGGRAVPVHEAILVGKSRGDLSQVFSHHGPGKVKGRKRDEKTHSFSGL